MSPVRFQFSQLNLVQVNKCSFFKACLEYQAGYMEVKIKPGMHLKKKNIFFLKKKTQLSRSLEYRIPKKQIMLCVSCKHVQTSFLSAC
jgi:hypothetical protein